MAIKTVLVHLAHDPDWENRLDSAIELARDLGAHLIALFVAHPVHMPAGIQGRGASHAFIREAADRARRDLTHPDPGDPVALTPRPPGYRISRPGQSARTSFSLSNKSIGSK